jgi:hypothetical protein
VPLNCVYRDIYINIPVPTCPLFCLFIVVSLLASFAPQTPAHAFFSLQPAGPAISEVAIPPVSNATHSQTVFLCASHTGDKRVLVKVRGRTSIAEGCTYR